MKAITQFRTKVCNMVWRIFECFFKANSRSLGFACWENSGSSGFQPWVFQRQQQGLPNYRTHGISQLIDITRRLAPYLLDLNSKGTPPHSVTPRRQAASVYQVTIVKHPWVKCRLHEGRDVVSFIHNTVPGNYYSTCHIRATQQKFSEQLTNK